MSADEICWLACLDRAIHFINGGYAEGSAVAIANAFYAALKKATE